MTYTIFYVDRDEGQGAVIGALSHPDEMERSGGAVKLIYYDASHGGEEAAVVLKTLQIPFARWAEAEPGLWPEFLEAFDGARAVECLAADMKPACILNDKGSEAQAARFLALAEKVLRLIGWEEEPLWSI